MGPPRAIGARIPSHSVIGTRSFENSNTGEHPTMQHRFELLRRVASIILLFLCIGRARCATSLDPVPNVRCAAEVGALMPARCDRDPAVAARRGDEQHYLEIVVYNREGDTLRSASVEDLASPRHVQVEYDALRGIHFIDRNIRFVRLRVVCPGYETQVRKFELYGSRQTVAVTLGRPGDTYCYGARGQVPYTPDPTALGFYFVPDTVIDAEQRALDTVRAEHRDERRALILEHHLKRWADRLEEISDETDVERDSIGLLSTLSDWGIIHLRDTSQRREILRSLRSLPFIACAGPLLARHDVPIMQGGPYLSLLTNYIAVEFLSRGAAAMDADSIAAEMGLTAAPHDPESRMCAFAADPGLAEEVNDIIARILPRETVLTAYTMGPIRTVLLGE